jgi:hypothetical protein
VWVFITFILFLIPRLSSDQILWRISLPRRMVWTSDVAAGILEAAGLMETDVGDVPAFGTSTIKPPLVVTSITNINWPSISTGENFFNKALANGNLESGDEVPSMASMP